MKFLYLAPASNDCLLIFEGQDCATPIRWSGTIVIKQQ